MRETRDDNDNGGCAEVLMWVAIITMCGWLLINLWLYSLWGIK